jgi:hypothetical protein
VAAPAARLAEFVSQNRGDGHTAMTMGLVILLVAALSLFGPQIPVLVNRLRGKSGTRFAIGDRTE